jgi:ribosomal protein S12 methylthiotransferase
MLGDLVRQGMSLTDDPASADAVIVNTCAFVEDAKAESIEAVMAAAALNEDGRRRRVVVTGCLAQRYGEALAADMPEADLVVGFQAGRPGGWGAVWGLAGEQGGGGEPPAPLGELG